MAERTCRSLCFARDGEAVSAHGRNACFCLRLAVSLGAATVTVIRAEMTGGSCCMC